MDWGLAIERNRAILLRLLAVLEGLLRVPMTRGVYEQALRLLRPAESVLRRVIVLAAREVTVTLRPALAFPEGVVIGGSQAKRIPSFPLLDPRLHPAPPPLPSSQAARIRFFDEPFEAAPAQETAQAAREKEAAALARRLARLRGALENLPRAARRLARWRVRHPSDVRRPMRPGRPPGYRAKPVHEIEHALHDLQQLTLWIYAEDTS